MCDYSLHHIASRPAKVNDKVFTTELARSRARGFAAVGEHGAKLVVDDAPPKVVVCLMPGTELSFDDDIEYVRAFSAFGKTRVRHKLARFRQVDLDDPHTQHDALEFPDGRVVKVGRLVAGQTARVLQLPVPPHSEPHHEHADLRRAVCPSDSRLALNRVSFRPGIASILMPSQGTVMLWRICCSTAVSLSITLTQSVHRMKTRVQDVIAKASLSGVDAMQIETKFERGAVETMSPRPTVAPKPAKEIALSLGGV